MSRAMRAEEAVGILRTLESVQQIPAVEPAVLDIFDGEAIARSLADINGVPRRMIRGDDATAAKRAAREQQQQMAMVAQAAPQIADVAANALPQRPAPAA